MLIQDSQQRTQPHALLVSASTEVLQEVCKALLRGCELCNAISVLAAALGQLEDTSVEAVCLILKSSQLQKQARQGQVGQGLALAASSSCIDSGLLASMQPKCLRAVLTADGIGARQSAFYEGTLHCRTQHS